VPQWPGRRTSTFRGRGGHYNLNRQNVQSHPYRHDRDAKRM
jgi:hypothetical protein